MKEHTQLINKEDLQNKLDAKDDTKSKYKIMYSKPLVIFVLITIFANAIIKIKIAYHLTHFIFKNISSLFTYCLKFFPNKDVFIFIYYINYLFLVFGIIALFTEPILQIYIRVTFIASEKKSLLYLIWGKIMYFVVLGLVPESTLLMFQFNNKNNVIIPLFIAKIYSQPILLIAFVIYGIFLLLSFKGKDIIINLKNHSYIYLGIIETIARWSYFNWKTIKEGDNEELNDGKREQDEDESLIQGKSTVIKISAFIAFFAVLLSPVLNGIFGYGFFVFFYTESLTRFLFKLDIVISVIFTLLTLRLIK